MKKIFVLAALTLLAGCDSMTLVEYPEKGSPCDGFIKYDWVRVKNNPDKDYTVIGFDTNQSNARLFNLDRTWITVSCEYLERINK